jgi:AraC-like DNA-binding protein
MEYKYELIKNDGNLPIKIIFHTSDDAQLIPRHWHESIEISYVLSGKIDDIYIDGVHYTSHQGDIVLINSNAIHSFSVVRGKNRKAVTFFVLYDFLKTYYPDIDKIAFDCVSIGTNDEEKIKKFNELRENLDSIIRVFSNLRGDSFAHIKIMGLSYELIYLLLKYFVVSKKSFGEIKTKKYLDRLTEITNYIMGNYNQDLSIDIISTKFNLSPEYLSRFFKKYMGMTIHNYINTVRLEKAYRDLMNTDRSITEIALEHGFPNEKSFNKVFKSFYNVTPNQYRKRSKR